MSIYGKIHTLYKGRVKTIGNPEAKSKMDQQWKTGAFKNETDEPIFLSEEGLKGDECADKKITAALKRHYLRTVWLITINGSASSAIRILKPEATVKILRSCIWMKRLCHIGDIYELGEAVIQVSQPRRPCWKPARRHQDIDLAKKR